MKISTTLAALAATTAATGFSATASADIIGSTVDLSVTHSGLFGPLSAINNFTYTYGSPSNISVPGWGNALVTSPTVAPGFDHAINLDFTLFSYSAFTGMFPAVGTVTLANLSEQADVASVRLLANGLPIGTGATAFGNGFQATWNSQDLFNSNPVAPNMTVAWNSVPGPSALAMLGLACLAPKRRRSR